ncbi:hypothetical protein [Magnetovirga frankeli]
MDQLQIRQGIDFQLVPDTHLPYPDGHFDVVISAESPDELFG